MRRSSASASARVRTAVAVRSCSFPTVTKRCATASISVRARIVRGRTMALATRPMKRSRLSAAMRDATTSRVSVTMRWIGEYVSAIVRGDGRSAVRMRSAAVAVAWAMVRTVETVVRNWSKEPSSKSMRPRATAKMRAPIPAPSRLVIPLRSSG